MSSPTATDWWGLLLLVGVIAVGCSLTLMFFVLRRERLRAVEHTGARRLALLLAMLGLACALISGTVHFVDNHGRGSVEAYGILGFVRSHPSFVVLCATGLLGIWASRVASRPRGSAGSDAEAEPARRTTS